MRVELSLEQIVRAVLGTKCPKPSCEGKLSVSYGWPIAVANLHIACTDCGTEFDPETAQFHLFEPPAPTDWSDPDWTDLQLP